MADYRDWCGHCGAEINFGSHKAGCAWVQKQDEARRALNDFNDALHKEYNGKTAEEVVDEAIQLQQDMDALASMLRGKEKLWEFIRYELMDKHAIEQYRERTGRRYL